MKTKSFRFQGIHLAYYDSESDLPPLLFCHANGYSAGCYRYYHERLKDKYRIIALDFAGHGKSESTLDFKNWNFFRDQILTLLDHEKIESVTSVGHSLGGASTLLASAKEPERFKKLIVWDPVVLGWKMITLSKIFGNPLARGAAKRRKTFRSMELIRRSYRKFPAFAKFDEGIFEDYISSCFKKAENGEEWELCCDPKVESRIFGHSHYLVFLDFYKITKETHVLIPEEYEVCGPKQAALITGKNEKSSVTVWSGITHFFPFEEPQSSLDWLNGKLEAP
ncbi:alpha/beta fold hydrolase [Leptospira idonii]|uniref:Alpha/beta hydrolase n=1 Tax=Leptospira idonii TaxID=1193500 RepID=A0A4R9LX74_9LEPT|nr:alpha/beta hydrolase [Leptospira idonii]TGN18913.1 alpha/beta hydrolase [Leptospira idonii]